MVERANHAVVILCRVLDVSRAGFYAWLPRGRSARAIANQAITEEIRVIHAESRGTYGAPRVHATLRAQGRHVGRRLWSG